MLPDNVTRLIKQLNSQNICYLHWKSTEHLLAGLQGQTDLDILLKKEHYEKFINCLIKCGYVHVRSIKWQTYPNVEDWIGYCPRTGIQTHVHLHTKLITGKPYVKEQYLPYDKLLLENRIKSEYGIYIVDPNIEIILLLIRTVIKQSLISPIPHNDKSFTFKKNVLKEYEYLKERIDRMEIERYSSVMLPENSDILISIIYESVTNNRMRSLKRAILKQLSAERRSSHTYSSILSFFRYSYIKLRSLLHVPLRTKKKLFQNDGLIVALIGVDGSGKTTISNIIAKDFSWKMDFRYFYLGTGDGSASMLNRCLRKMSAAKKKKRSSNKKNSDPSYSRKQTPSGIKLLVMNFNSLINAREKYKSCKKMDALRKSGGIAITDRYPQMQFEGINDGVHITDTGIGLFSYLNKSFQKKEKEYIKKACLFAPDVVIKLTIPYEVSRMRKQDSSEETIRRKIDIINQLHFEGSKEFIVDNTSDIDTAVLAVKEIIWKNFFSPEMV